MHKNVNCKVNVNEYKKMEPVMFARMFACCARIKCNLNEYKLCMCVFACECRTMQCLVMTVFFDETD